MDTATPLALLIPLLLTGYAACYLVVCAVFPWVDCRRCHGTGKLRNPIARRTFRHCPRCDGTGKRIRIGRRIYEHLRTERERGTR